MSSPPLQQVLSCRSAVTLKTSFEPDVHKIVAFLILTQVFISYLYLTMPILTEQFGLILSSKGDVAKYATLKWIETAAGTKEWFVDIRQKENRQWTLHGAALKMPEFEFLTECEEKPAGVHEFKMSPWRTLIVKKGPAYEVTLTTTDRTRYFTLTLDEFGIVIRNKNLFVSQSTQAQK